MSKEAIAKQQILNLVGKKLEEISKLYKPEVKLTFISRHPGNEEGDVLVTNDTLEELTKVLERSKARELVDASVKRS